MTPPEVDCIDCLDCYCGEELRQAIQTGENLIKQKFLRKTERPIKVPKLKPSNPKKKKHEHTCPCLSRTKPTPNKSVGQGRNKPSLRVLELACPTKRHCLQTLKDKAHILSSEAIEKLTEQVLSKGPMLGVDDAVNMWTKRSNRLKRQNQKLTKLMKKDEKFRQYAILLTRKLLPHIEYPYDIALSPELQKLSYVVAKDIKSIWKKRKCESNEIITDVSKKMAIWMTTIVEKAEELLLEDDIRDLEEQYWPVFDVMDEIFDRVMEQCMESGSYVSSEDTFAKSISNSSTDKGSKVKFTSSQEDYKMIAATSKEVVQDVLDKASLSIINQMKSVDDYDIEDLYKDINSLNPNVNSDNNSLDEFFTNMIDDLITNNLDYEEDVSTKDANVSLPVDKDASLSKNIDQSISHSLSSDETSRKVTFSAGELDEPWRETIKNLVLSEVKPSLISDTDDEWPANHVPVVKSLLKISKSISSLGVIEERPKDNNESYDDETPINYHSNINMVLDVTLMNNDSVMDGDNINEFDNEKNTTQKATEITNFILGTGSEIKQKYEALPVSNLTELDKNELHINVLKAENSMNLYLNLQEQLQSVNSKEKLSHSHDELEPNIMNPSEYANLEDKPSNQDQSKQGAIEIEEGKALKSPEHKHLHENMPTRQITSKHLQNQSKIITHSDMKNLKYPNSQNNGQISVDNEYQGNKFNKNKSITKKNNAVKDTQKKINENQCPPSGNTSSISRLDSADFNRNSQTPNENFNYKVDPGATPLRTIRDEIELKRAHRKYCADLQSVAERLEHWAQWIDMNCVKMLVISRCGNALRSRAACVCRASSPWLELRVDVAGRAVFWREFAQHAARVLAREDTRARGTGYAADDASPRCACHPRRG